MTRRAVVTGTFSYTGAAVAAELVARGFRVHALTNRRAPASTSITASPLAFEPGPLRRALAGADLLVNTYWVRLPHAGQSFETAVARSRILFEAAVAAGVGRIVHVSVANAERGRDLGYYRGKAELEERVRALPIPHAIVKPTLVVGPNDVLTSNIAWLLRRFPFFPVPAARARLQPVTLGETARLLADASEVSGNVELDAAGPDVVTFREYIGLVARACGVRRLLVPAPARLALAGLAAIQPLLGDVVLTREELLGLQRELLLSRRPARGSQSVGNWLTAHGSGLGRRYVNDRRRHFGDRASEPILDPGQPTWH